MAGGFVLKEGSGKPVAAYSRCAVEVYAQAELVLLMEEAEKKYPYQGIIGFYDVDPSYSLGRFLRVMAKNPEIELSKWQVAQYAVISRFYTVACRECKTSANWSATTRELAEDLYREHWKDRHAKGAQ